MAWQRGTVTDDQAAAQAAALAAANAAGTSWQGAAQNTTPVADPPPGSAGPTGPTGPVNPTAPNGAPPPPGPPPGYPADHPWPPATFGYDPNALGGKGAWVTYVKGSPLVVQVDANGNFDPGKSLQVGTAVNSDGSAFTQAQQDASAPDAAHATAPINDPYGDLTNQAVDAYKTKTPGGIVATSGADAAKAAADKLGITLPTGSGMDPQMAANMQQAYQNLVGLGDQENAARQSLSAAGTTPVTNQAIQYNPYGAMSYDAPTVQQAQAINTRGLQARAQTISSQNIATPGAVQAQQVNAPTVNVNPNIQAARVAAQQIQAPGGVSAPMSVNPGTVQAAQMAQPTSVTGSVIGRQALDQGQANQSRAQQQSALGLMQGAAQGTAPSAAEALLQKGVQDSQSTALGMAATLQGTHPGLALRQGLSASQDAIAKSAADAAALRAQEMATARGQYSDAAGAMRTQDLGAATTQLQTNAQIAQQNAANQQQANLANQQTAFQTGQFNAGNQQQAALANQSARLAAGQSNQQAQLSAATTTLQAQLDAAKANQQAALQAGNATAANQMQAQVTNLQAQLDAQKTNAASLLTAGTANQQNSYQTQVATLQAQLEAAKANQSAALAAGQSNQASALQAQIQSMQAQLAAAQANLASQTSTNQQQANLSAAAAQFNATSANDAAKTNAMQDMAAQQANQTAALQAAGLNYGQYLGLTQAQQNAYAAPYNALVQQQQIAAQQNAANQTFYASLLGTLGKVAAS